jgi:hypothetical protein
LPMPLSSSSIGSPPTTRTPQTFLRAQAQAARLKEFFVLNNNLSHTYFVVRQLLAKGSKLSRFWWTR